MKENTDALFQIPEQYYTILFEALAGNNVLLLPNTPTFTILAATPSYVQQAGYIRKGLIGKGIFEAFPGNSDPNDTGKSALNDSLNYVLRHRKAHQLQIQRYDVAGEDGEYMERYWKASNKPVFAPNGDIAYIVHSAEDITAQIKADKKEELHQVLQTAFDKVEKSQTALKQFKFMADQATDPFILMRQDGSFAYLNNKALQAWGYTAEEAMQIRVPDVDPIYNYERFLDVFNRAQVEEIPPFETLHKTKDGHTYPVEVSMGGLTLDGQPHMFAVARNISERKKAEEDLREFATRLRNIIEQAPMAIAVTRGEEMVFESINPPMCQVINKKSEDEVLGKPLIEVLPELQGQAFPDLLRSILATGKNYTGTEVPADLLVDGVMVRRYFDISYSRILEAGKTPAILHMVVDVTDKVLARERVQESEGRFRLLADASPNLIWMLNPDGSYNYVNRTTLEFIGMTQEEISAVGWEALQHPDDLENAKQVLKKAIQSHERYEMEHRLRTKDGRYRWVLSQAIPAYDEKGEVFAYVGSSIDIDESKKSRQQLETALEQARLSKEAAELGTFDMELENGNMHWDSRCRALFGISHNGPVSFEHDFMKRLHPDDQERVAEAVNRAFDQRLSNGEYDVEYRTIGAEDKIERWVRAKGKVYFNSANKPMRFIGSVLDITAQVGARREVENLVAQRTKELAAANETLSVLNKELQRSNQNLEEFAHAASHDLKEPIRKVHFFTQQLRDQLSERLKEAELRSFGRIENATQRMRNLIDDLLLYSHVSQRPHATESVDLNEKISRVLEDLELDIEEKKAVINVGRLPVVQGYRRQLQQMLQNLLSNALKYSKSDVAPWIDVTAERVEQDGKSYDAIKIADNGIGFAQEHQEKIFQIFSRLHGQGEYSGTGVGLSIVKKVVENHNGFIKVASTPERVQCFRSFYR